MFQFFIVQIIVILARHGFYFRVNLFPTVVGCHAAGEGFDKLWDSDRHAACSWAETFCDYRFESSSYLFELSDFESII